MQLQEITRGSAGRLYSYASIIELSNKVVMFKDASGVMHEIVRKYVVRVTKLTEDEYMRLGASPAAAARHLMKKKKKSTKRKAMTMNDDETESSDASSSEASSDVSSEASSEGEGHGGQRGGGDYYY